MEHLLSFKEILKEYAPNNKSAESKSKRKKAKMLNDEALFSTHEITSEQLREQREFYEELKRGAKKHWKPLVRFYNYWIKGIY